MANKANTKLCDPCVFEGKSMTGVYYCPDCKEHLCKLCTKHHNKFRLLRQHLIVDVKIEPRSVATAPTSTSPLEAGEYVNLQDESETPCPKIPKRDKLVQPSVTSARDEEDYDLPIELDIGGMNLYQNTENIVHVTPVIEQPPEPWEDHTKQKAPPKRRAVPNEYVQQPVGSSDQTAANKPEGANFKVTVEDSTLSALCKMTGEMLLSADSQGISFSKPAANVRVYAFQYKWIRRYGIKGSQQFYFEVGRRCPNGEGTITLSTNLCRPIYKYIMRFASSKHVK